MDINYYKQMFTFIPSQFGNIVQEQFGAVGDTKERSAASTMIGTLVMIVALYFAFLCRKNGTVDPVQLLYAVCCSPCYIAYRLAIPCIPT